MRRTCAFFAPEPIPLSLLYGDKVVSLQAPYDPSLRDPILLGRLVREIGRYALARVDQGQSSIQIHRLVQAVLRDQMSVEGVTFSNLIIADLMIRLDRSPLFSNVALGSATHGELAQHDVVQFKLTMNLTPADMAQGDR